MKSRPANPRPAPRAAPHKRAVQSNRAEDSVMGIVNDRLLEELSAKDDLAFKLGDTLDMKASIGLVVITFLGTQTAYLLDKHVTGLSHILQAGSVVALVIATIASIVELWLRRYLMIEPEANTASRIVELQNYYSPLGGDVEANVLEQLTKEQIEWTLARITTNKAQNRAKGRWLDWAFKATAVSMLLNLITFVVVWLTNPF